MVIILQFVFIIFLKMGVNGALTGMLIANILTTMLVMLMEKNILTFNPDMKMIKIAFKFSLALVPYLLIYWGLTKGGKFILEHNAELSTVGIFAVLMTIAGIVIIVVDAAISGIRPFLFDTFAREEQNADEAKIDLFNSLMILLPLIAIPPIVLVATNIGLVTNKDGYTEIAHYVTLASLVTFILVYGKMFYQQLIFVKRSDLLTTLSFVVLIVLVVGLLSLVPDYKIWGVLVSMLIANIVMAILFYGAAQKRLPVSYKFQKVFLFPFCFFITLFGLEWLCTQQLGLSHAWFGLVQFIVLLSLILVMNYKMVGEYRALFVGK